MKILIIEDEIHIARHLEKKVRIILNGTDCDISRAGGLEEALSYLDSNEIDLLLLDLNLGGKDGFEVLKLLSAGSFHTIVVSAYKNRAIEAFEYGVIDFVPKPFSEERLRKALSRITEAADKPDYPAQYYAIRKRGRIHLVKDEEVAYFQAFGHYSKIHLKNGQTELHNKSLARLEPLLGENYDRVYKSYEMHTEFMKSIVDVDDDGWLDLYLANEPFPIIYRNDGTGAFTEEENSILRDSSSIAYSSIWGDYNNDGRLDVYLSNWGRHPETPQDNRLFRQLSAGFEFSMVEENISMDSNFTWSSSWVDFDRDGDLDLLATTALNFGNGFNYIFRNERGNQNNWINLQCIGTASNRAAIGARAWVKANIGGEEVWQLRHISGSPSGDRSQSSLRAHFGLGDAVVIDSLIVEYPSGIRDIFTNVQPNQHCRLTEGQGFNCSLINRYEEEEKTRGTVRLCPNPGDAATVTVAYELARPAEALQVELYNARGQLLRRHAYPATGAAKGELPLKVPGLPPGMYWVSLRTGDVVLGDSLLIR